MSMLDIAGQQLTSLTPYNEYLTDVIIAVIVYLSAFSLVIKMLITGRKKRRAIENAPKPASEPVPDKDETPPDAASAEKGGDEQ